VAIIGTDIASPVRRLLRQVNSDPITDDHIADAIEDAIDDLSNKLPFLSQTYLLDTVYGQQEYDVPLDILEIAEVSYLDSPGTSLKTEITASSTTDIAAEESIVDFPDSGTIVIDLEQITYTSKDDELKLFKGVTRAANDTVGSAHSVGAIIYEADTKWVRLEPTSSITLGNKDESFRSSPVGIVSSYYWISGKLGFDVPIERTSVAIVEIRCFVRPPALEDESGADLAAEIQGLPVSLKKGFKYLVASQLAMILAQDEASVLQSNRWYQVYMGELSQYMTRQHLMERGINPQVVPYTGRG
jgi:hypothetical protein